MFIAHQLESSARCVCTSVGCVGFIGFRPKLRPVAMSSQHPLIAQLRNGSTARYTAHSRNLFNEQLQASCRARAVANVSTVVHVAER